MDAGWRDGEVSNDTLTFESETNKSISIKLFIFVFTAESEGFGANEGEREERWGLEKVGVQRKFLL